MSRILIFLTGLFLASPVFAIDDNAQPVLGVQANGEACLLGGRLDGKLAPAPKLAPHMFHGDIYRLYTLNTPAGVAPAIGKPHNFGSAGEECTGFWPQELALDPLRRKTRAIALRRNKSASGPKPARVARLDKNSPELVEAVRAILEKKGIKNPFIRIVQAISADFNGDGKPDALINAVRVQRAKERRGDYSLIFLRIDGVAEPVVIQSEISQKDSNWPGDLWINTIVSVIDIDGDGAAEIVLNGQSEFGGGWEVIRLQEGKAIHALFCGCEG